MIGRILPFRRPANRPGDTPARQPPAPAPEGPPAPGRAPPRAAGGGGKDDGPGLGAAETERFRRLILPYLDDAYGLARLLARDPTAAEDIVQEAFVRALRGFHTFRGDNPKAWLYAIVRNCFLSWAAGSDRRFERAPSAAEPLAEVASEDDTPETALLRQGEIDSVRAAVEAIPEPFREALALRELDELSYREIAEITGAPIGTVMSRLARARQMLLAVLGPASREEAGR
jgi:RNA polymerase sigma-70 factor (ECF subfamily)